MYLGIDLGTSELKVLLIDAQQQVLCTVGVALEVQRPQPLWSEQNPEDWWRATLSALRQVQALRPVELAAVRGIGLSGQMHGAVLLDAEDRVVRPAMLWNDVRSGAQCVELQQRVPQLQEITGNLAMPGFTAPKVLWVAQHEPDIFRATKKILLPKDYLRFKLSGEYISDMSDASGTLWLDVAQRDWSDVMLAACGLTRAHMPRLVEGSAVGGVLKPELSALWGMAQAVIAGGAGDNAASAIGMGVIVNNQSLLSLGTSGVLFVANDSYRPNPAQGLHTFCHALPHQWHQMGVMLSAASCLRWVTHLTHAVDEAQLLAEIERLDPSSCLQAPLFLPYLAGERTPHNDPNAKGVWFGLGHDTDRALLGYSVLEGVAFGLLDSCHALQDAGSDVSVASLVGGGSKSEYWATLLASVLNMTLQLHDSAEVGAALGAARLGMLAANPELDSAAVCTAPAIIRRIAPDAERHRILMHRYARFRQLYTILRPVFQSVPT